MIKISGWKYLIFDQTPRHCRLDYVQIVVELSLSLDGYGEYSYLLAICICSRTLFYCIYVVACGGAGDQTFVCVASACRGAQLEIGGNWHIIICTDITYCDGVMCPDYQRLRSRPECRSWT